MLTVTSIPGDFLMEAPRFVNDCVMGTLSATLVAHPSINAAQVDLYPNPNPDPDLSIDVAQVEAAVEALRYGTVALNTWTGSCFQFESGSWGAFPGEKLDAVQS